ncbi:MAG TPA: helix-hairpin-helix domain-containing protein [Burkholderiaceae bacterium]|nr:helix-hairpin-helix domain-containing protein [Burkholderiaceae bacterium]
MAATNARIAAVFEEIADLLEVQGENPFRIRAYRNAARMVNQQGPPFAERAARGEALGKLFGVGADLDAKIHEIARTGNCELLQQLRRAAPRGTTSLLRIPGLGPKRVRALAERLDIHTPVQLRQAAQSGRMEALRGFGPKTTSHVLRALATDRTKKERVPLADAQRDAGAVLAHLRRAPGISTAVVAGSLRRQRPTVGDIDLLAAGADGDEIARHFTSFPRFREVLAQGATKASAVLDSRMQVDLRVVPAASFGAALLYFTGPKAFNIELRKRAIDQGLKLNEYGLYKGTRLVAGSTEQSVLDALGVDWVAPEARDAAVEALAPA